MKWNSTKCSQTKLAFPRFIGMGLREIIMWWSLTSLGLLSKTSSVTASGSLVWKQFSWFQTKWYREFSLSTWKGLSTETSNLTTSWWGQEKELSSFMSLTLVSQKGIKTRRQINTSLTRKTGVWSVLFGTWALLLTRVMNSRGETTSSPLDLLSSISWKELFLGRDWSARRERRNKSRSLSWKRQELKVISVQISPMSSNSSSITSTNSSLIKNQIMTSWEDFSEDSSWDKDMNQTIVTIGQRRRRLP